MRTMMRAFFAASCGIFWLTAAAQAQKQRTPRISHVQPMGGQLGSTFELRVTGLDLVDVEGLHFNFPGVKVETGSSEKTVLPPKEMKKAVKGQPPPPVGLVTHKFTVTLPAT